MAAVKNSKIDLKTAEKMMVDFIQSCISSSSCPSAGNSIHCDKQFLQKYMPNFTEHLHYRIIDVSSIKELCRYILQQEMVPRNIELSPREEINTYSYGRHQRKHRRTKVLPENCLKI
ncbi:putative oligoribonuclease [Crassostrea virginica]